MLFDPTALILASAAQQRHLAGSRVGGPIDTVRPRRRSLSALRFSGTTSASAPRTGSTRRLATLRPSSV